MLIDQLFPNDVITESAYGAAAGVETIKQLIHAVKDSKDIDLKVGPEMFPVRYDEARYLLSLWKANRDGGDKTADLFGNVNWIQDKLEDRDYRMGPGKLKDIDIERAKEIQKDKVLNLESCGKCPVTGEDECHCDDNKEVEEGLEDVKPKDEEARQILNMLRVFFDDKEGYQDAVALDAVDYLNNKGLLKDFINTLPYFDVDYEEFLDSYDKDFLEKRFGITEDSDEMNEYATEPKDQQDRDAKVKVLNALLADPNTSKDPQMKQAIQKRLAQLSVNEDYKGWKYDSEIIDYDDNRKISHFATKDGKEVSMDWSPYSTPSEEDFALWVDLGMPTRKAVNGIGPLNIDDLIQLAKDKPEVTHSLLVKEEDKEAVDQEKLDAKTKIALKKAGLKYGAQTKGDPLAALTTFVADKDSEKTQDIGRLDQENDEEDKLIAQQDVVDKEHSKKLGNNDLQDKYQDQEIERLKQDLQKLLAR